MEDKEERMRGREKGGEKKEVSEFCSYLKPVGNKPDRRRVPVLHAYVLKLQVVSNRQALPRHTHKL